MNAQIIKELLMQGKYQAGLDLLSQQEALIVTKNKRI